MFYNIIILKYGYCCTNAFVFLIPPSSKHQRWATQVWRREWKRSLGVLKYQTWAANSPSWSPGRVRILVTPLLTRSVCHKIGDEVTISWLVPVTACPWFLLGAEQRLSWWFTGYCWSCWNFSLTNSTPWPLRTPWSWDTCSKRWPRRAASMTVTSSSMTWLMCGWRSKMSCR